MPGSLAEYKPGIVFLYQDLKVPVCPLALNSGMFWPRRSFLRYPGTIVVEFLDPIPPGLPRQQFMDRHLLPWVGTRRNIRADVIVDLQFALCLQDQDGHGGKLLGRRAQVKRGVWCIRYLFAPVGHAIALAQEHFAMVCEKH